MTIIEDTFNCNKPIIFYYYKCGETLVEKNQELRNVLKISIGVMESCRYLKFY